MECFLIFLTFIQMFVMANGFPVVTSVNIITQHDTDYLYPVDTVNRDTTQLYTVVVDDVYQHYEDLPAANDNNVLIGQDQAEEKAILESQFLGKILPPFLLRQEYKPQDMHKASKRGGKMLNKRTR
jgi:hypothetical protein